VEDDAHQCLYVGTLWEAEVITDRRDVEEFKEVPRTIGCVLLVRVLSQAPKFLALDRCIPQSYNWLLLALCAVSCRSGAGSGGLLREAANAHAEAAVAREVKLQAQIKVAQEIQCVKEAMEGEAQKEAAAMKKELEVAERKVKDAAADLQVVIEGKFSRSPQVNFMCFLSSFC
jgi:hypothetical protein